MTAVSSRPRPRAVRLLDRLAYPHGVAGYVDAYRPGAHAGQVPATVVDLTPRTARATSLLLAPARPMVHTPGQHLLVTAEIAGVRLTRCYSISDSPHRPDRLLEITVAHLPDGTVSGHLTNRTATGIRVGDAIGLSAPQGNAFVLPSTRPDRVLLIGGGSGATPLRAMWRTMDAEGLGARVSILLYARTADDALFADELAGRPGAHVVTTREPRGALTGRFSADHLTALGITPGEVEAFACGPVGLVDAVRGVWDAAGAGARVHTESFAPPAAPVSDTAPTGLLTFTSSGVSAHNDGRTLLEQAEAAGLAPASGCRMGICHTCITTRHAGAVRDIRTGAVDSGEGDEIQPCISQPVGDVAVAL